MLLPLGARELFPEWEKCIFPREGAVHASLKLELFPESEPYPTHNSQERFRNIFRHSW
jgi:hypothetical protein